VASALDAIPPPTACMMREMTSAPRKMHRYCSLALAHEVRIDLPIVE
jgi:hypothetical protein